MNEFGRTVDVGGLATHYHDEGDGPVVLLIHGSGPGVTAHANWRMVLPELSKDFRVIAPDVLGFGHTEIPAGVSYDIETWLCHIIGFLDALGVDRCAVVGNSFGGALALHLAARQPHRVDRLVLMGSVGISFPITDGLETAWGYEPSPEAMRELLDRFAYSDGLVGDDLVRTRYEASLRPGVQEAYAAMFPAPRQAAVDALALDESKLSGIDCDVLLVHGRDDRIIPVEVSRRLANRLPRAGLHVIPECGHWVQIEKADEFRTLVRTFLDQHEPVGQVGPG